MVLVLVLVSLELVVAEKTVWAEEPVVEIEETVRAEESLEEVEAVAQRVDAWLDGTVVVGRFGARNVSSKSEGRVDVEETVDAWRDLWLSGRGLAKARENDGAGIKESDESRPDDDAVLPARGAAVLGGGGMNESWDVTVDEARLRE